MYKSLSRSALLAVCCLPLGWALSQELQQKPAGDSDLAALQGNWIGREDRVTPANQLTMSVQGNVIEIKGPNPDERYKGTLTLNPTANPKQGDLVVQESSPPHYAGRTSLSVYRIDADGTLTLAVNEPGAPMRPQGFDGGDRMRVFVFRKEQSTPTSTSTVGQSAPAPAPTPQQATFNPGVTTTQPTPSSPKVPSEQPTAASQKPTTPSQQPTVVTQQVVPPAPSAAKSETPATTSKTPEAPKPAEAKPAEASKAAETKPAETKSTETKPSETKPAETKPTEKKASESNSTSSTASLVKGADPAATAEKTASTEAGQEPLRANVLLRYVGAERVEWELTIKSPDGKTVAALTGQFEQKK